MIKFRCVCGDVVRDFPFMRAQYIEDRGWVIEDSRLCLNLEIELKFMVSPLIQLVCV